MEVPVGQRIKAKERLAGEYQQAVFVFRKTGKRDSIRSKVFEEGGKGGRWKGGENVGAPPFSRKFPPPFHRRSLPDKALDPYGEQ